MNDKLTALLTAVLGNYQIAGVSEIKYDPADNDGQIIESTYHVELEAMAEEDVMGFGIEVSRSKLKDLELVHLIYSGPGTSKLDA